MSLRGLLALLTILWAWLDGYPQWQRCQRAQAEALALRAEIDRDIEGVKYLPALRQALQSLPPVSPANPPKARTGLRLTIKSERLPSPASPGETVSGYNIRLTGSRAEVTGWLQSLTRRFSVQRLELQHDSGQIRGQLRLLEAR